MFFKNQVIRQPDTNHSSHVLEERHLVPVSYDQYTNIIDTSKNPLSSPILHHVLGQDQTPWYIINSRENLLVHMHKKQKKLKTLLKPMVSSLFLKDAPTKKTIKSPNPY